MFAHRLYCYSSVNQKSIALVLMVHPNGTYNTHEHNNTPYNGIMRQFSPPAQTPLRQRASTGQLNEFLPPSAPLRPQASSSWSQAPNTTPHLHSHQWSQNESQYQTMLPPVFTPTPSGSGSSRTFSHKLSVDKKLNILSGELVFADA